MATRRRGHVSHIDVVQSFGCTARYIQQRTVVFTRDPAEQTAVAAGAYRAWTTAPARRLAAPTPLPPWRRTWTFPGVGRQVDHSNRGGRDSAHRRRWRQQRHPRRAAQPVLQYAGPSTINLVAGVTFADFGHRRAAAAQRPRRKVTPGFARRSPHSGRGTAVAVVHPGHHPAPGASPALAVDARRRRSAPARSDGDRTPSRRPPAPPRSPMRLAPARGAHRPGEAGAVRSFHLEPCRRSRPHCPSRRPSSCRIRVTPAGYDKPLTQPTAVGSAFRRRLSHVSIKRDGVVSRASTRT